MGSRKCTRCGVTGDFLVETQKLGGHLFGAAMLLVALVTSVGSLVAAATVYSSAGDIVDARSEIRRIEASLGPTNSGEARYPVRARDGSMWTVSDSDLGTAEETGAEAISPAAYREASEGSIKREITSHERGLVVATLLGLIALGATVRATRLIGRRQRFWRTYERCAACNTRTGRLRRT